MNVSVRPALVVCEVIERYNGQNVKTELLSRQNAPMPLDDLHCAIFVVPYGDWVVEAELLDALNDLVYLLVRVNLSVSCVRHKVIGRNLFDRQLRLLSQCSSFLSATDDRRLYQGAEKRTTPC